jgi:hypothetical protein
VSPWGQTERRLRDIEQRYAGAPDVGADVAWLVHELRQSRSALLRIMARCQDAPEESLAQEIGNWVNDVTRMYVAKA